MADIADQRITMLLLCFLTLSQAIPLRMPTNMESGLPTGHATVERGLVHGVHPVQ